MTSRRVTPTIAHATVAAFCIAALSACASRSHQSQSLQSTVSAKGSVPVIDSVAARLVALELARTARRAVYEDWAPEVINLNDRIGALHEQLLANSTRAATPRAVMLEVLKALEQRRAQLVVEHRQLLVKYYPQADPVRRNVAEQVAVDARRDELRSSLGMAAVEAGSR